jgi:hypothetical protein
MKKFKPAPKRLVKKARKAVEQVLDESDLKALWVEAEAAEWEKSTRALLNVPVKLEVEVAK